VKRTHLKKKRTGGKESALESRGSSGSGQLDPECQNWQVRKTNLQAIRARSVENILLSETDRMGERRQLNFPRVRTGG